MNDGCTHFDTGVGWKLQGRVDINIFITVNILQEKKKKVEEGMLVLSLVSVSTHLSVALRPKTTI